VLKLNLRLLEGTLQREWGQAKWLITKEWLFPRNQG
jgi:hypothetical protein